ncbi:MAG: hypothetical protein ACRD8A_12185 [Candidatus Acidiferrales bacterium]
MRQSKIAIAVVSAAFVFLVAVPRAALAAPPTDACSLASAAQISALLGIHVGPGERVVPNSPKLCGFGGATAAKRAMLAVITPDSFAREKHPLEGIKEEQAPGLGDDAHYMTTPGFGTGLSVLKGGFAFKVRVYGFPVQQVEQKEKMLAQEILARM